jgi:hypothetical protein
MAQSMTPEELQEQIALRRERFKVVIADLRAVLKDDLGAFVTKQARAAFLAHPQVAEAMPDAALKAFKAKSSTLAQEMAERIDRALALEPVWLEGSPSDDRRSLAEAPRVWGEVTKVEAETHAFLQEHGLAGEGPAAYRAPLYFVNGRYFPSLAEHYWRLREELATLEAEHRQTQAHATRKSLEARWEDA